MKLLLMLNEETIGGHDDVHRALQRLVEKGKLESFHVYSFLARLADGLSNDEVIAEILETAVSYQPTAILWFHTGKLKVGEEAIKSLQELSSKPVMGYWDGDIYKKPYNPLPKNIFRLVKRCDVSFWQGYWHMIEDLRKSGCKDIRYVPGFTDDRFESIRQKDIVFDVVMVANYITSKIPWRTFPGSRWRKKIAEFFYKKLGPRFAVFGDRWHGPYAHGPVSFLKQNQIYHKSRVVLGVNSSFVDYYFSNRLPICMSSGVVIVHNYQKGLENIFKNLNSPLFFKTTEEAWDITKRLLARTQSELDDIGLRSRTFTLDKLTGEKAMEYMVNVLQDYKSAQETGKALHVRPNPWIAAPRF